MESTLSFTEKLQYEGVLSMGFGILPKFVMLDTDISIEAKAIYAYLCSLAGNGTTTFPKRETILANLKICKDAYYKYFKELLEQGYIVCKRQRRGGDFGANVFTIVSNPKKFEDKAETNSPEYSRLRFAGIKAVGYGMVPRSAMLDERLEIKAKGLYAYFCTYTANGNNSFPKQEKILLNLSIGRQTYYRLYNQLVKLGYINVVQRSESGRFSVNDYYLNDNPTAVISEKNAETIDENTYESPCAEKQDTQDIVVAENATLNIGCPEIQHTVIPYTVIPYTVKQDTVYNQVLYKTSNIYNQSIPQSKNEMDGRNEISEEDVETEIRSENGIPTWYATDQRRAEVAVKLILEWNTFHNGYTDELQQDAYNLCVQAMSEMITAKASMTLRGNQVSCDKVIEQINASLEIEPDYISLWSVAEQAIRDFIEGSRNTKIKNFVSYMKACIWNAFFTHKISVSTAVYRDFGINHSNRR